MSVQTVNPKDRIWKANQNSVKKKLQDMLYTINKQSDIYI